MDDLFDINNAQWGVMPAKEKKENPNIHNAGAARRKTEMLEIPDNTRYRRAYGEVKLLELAGLEELKDGHSYHFITGGDVDSLSYLKFVMLHQPKLDYLLCSTWCMAAADVLQFREWIEGGAIKKMDFYVGEIFPNTYGVEWYMVNQLINDTQCGRVVSFRNHSKIYAGVGERFAFVIESSANINTNPRTEQGVITINRDLYQFYKDWFDKIK